MLLFLMLFNYLFLLFFLVLFTPSYKCNPLFVLLTSFFLGLGTDIFFNFSGTLPLVAIVCSTLKYPFYILFQGKKMAQKPPEEELEEITGMKKLLYVFVLVFIHSIIIHLFSYNFDFQKNMIMGYILEY